LGRDLADPGIDRSAVLDHGGDQLAGEGRGGRIAFDLGEMSLEDGLRRALAEVGLEDRGERESTSRASPPLPVSLRRHRR
jgi:hypothetical protein